VTPDPTGPAAPFLPESPPSSAPRGPSQRRWLVVSIIGVALLGGVGALAWPGVARMWKEKVQKDWFARAQSNESQGIKAEAARDYKRAEEAGLSTPEFYTRWAVFEMNTLRGFAAEAHFIRALELDSHYGPARVNLAELYRRRGWDAQAAQQYALAAGLLPDSTARLYAIAGGLYEKLGNHQRAVDMYDSALSARPGYLPALEGLLRLGEPMPVRTRR
jgi:tetratricopeptide (TPR) repeat protein